MPSELGQTVPLRELTALFQTPVVERKLTSSICKNHPRSWPGDGTTLSFFFVLAPPHMRRVTVMTSSVH